MDSHLRRLSASLVVALTTWHVALAADLPDWIEVRRVTDDVDSLMESRWKANKVQPAPVSGDAAFLRRIWLDLAGKIPRVATAREFLGDESPDRRRQLIDRLLASPTYVTSQADLWQSALIPEAATDQQLRFLQPSFEAWLRDQLREDVPYDEFVRELLTTPIRNIQGGPRANREPAPDVFFRGKQLKPENLAAATARSFLGVRLECAQCHDHPFVKQWKQENYYGLAAFLGRTQEARIGNSPIFKERAEGEVTFINTSQEEKTAKLLFLDGRVFDEPTPPEDRDKWYAKGSDGLPDTPYFSRRTILADYALTAESALFKRAIVNRLWKQLMGRGLVEPVDQMHEANPASHPALLNRLADDFATHGFDLRRLMAGMLHSETYLRSTRWTDSGPRPDDREYAAAIMKPLTADQLAVSIGIVTGHYDQMCAKFEREKKNRKISEVTPAIARGFYSREREVREFASRFRTVGEGFEANAGQALFLSYNSLMQKRLQPSRGNLVERLVKQPDNEAAVSDAFLTVLSRPPSRDERKRTVDFLSADDPSRPQLCQELVWALLCSGEFRFNH